MYNKLFIYKKNIIMNTNSPTNTMFDSNNLMNMMMGGYTMSMMTSLKDTSFSYDKIIIFIALICMNDIKKYLLELIEYIKTNLPKYLYENINKIQLFTPKEIENCQIIDIEQPSITHTNINVGFKPNLFSINALHHYLLNNNAKLTNNFGLNIESFDKHELIINYDNCNIIIDDDTNSTLMSNIKITYNSENNTIINFAINDNDNDKCYSDDDIIKYSESPFYADIMFPDVKKKVEDIFNKITYKQLNNFDSCVFNQIYLDIQKKRYKGEYTKYHCLQYAINACFPYYLILLYLENLSTDQNKDKNNIIINFLILIAVEDVLNKNHKLTLGWINTNTLEIYYNGLKLYKLKFNKFPLSSNIKWENEHIMIYYGVKINQLLIANETVNNTKNTESQLFFNVYHNKIIDEKILYDKFVNFYKNEILQTIKKENLKIKSNNITVYSIGIKKTEEIKEEVNPEYTEWQELLKLNDTNNDNKKESSNSNLISELIKMKPSKTITKTIHSSTVECKVVNVIHKDLKTLYLREIDKLKLCSIVDKFKNKKDLYDQLGIPHKLGMMFHGCPGTGKTTSIKAIATYLEKDMYFVNLKNIKTNSELKTIFDHINEKCNGGIIVFEDIDAMTKIVLRRKKLEESSLTDVLEEANDDITLQYLLNLLDGSLCKDGTIFAITTNYIENIDEALYRKGRVDICIEFKKCDHYQINMIFESIIGHKLDNKILEKIPENKYAPCDIIFHVYQYMLEDIDDEIIMKEFMNK